MAQKELRERLANANFERMEYLIEPEDPPSKREVLSHALRLFVRDGLCETGIRAIAEASGYTNPALYKFFASKDALALYLFERCYLLVYERLQTAVALTEDTDARLAGVVKEWVALTDTHLDAVLFMNEGLRDFWPRVRPAVKRKSLLRLLEALVPADARVDPSLGVAKIVGTLGQVARQRFFGAFSDSRKLGTQLHTLLTWNRT